MKAIKVSRCEGMMDNMYIVSDSIHESLHDRITIHVCGDIVTRITFDGMVIMERYKGRYIISERNIKLINDWYGNHKANPI